MEARTGNGPQAKAVGEAKPQAPRDRKLPLKSVDFNKPEPIEGCPLAVRHYESGKQVDKEHDAVCPKLFLDPELQVVLIGERHFPMHLVHFYVRAKAA